MRLSLLRRGCERAGRLDEAGEVYLRLTAFRSRFHGAESPEAAAPTHRLGRVLLAQGRFEEAEEILRRSMVAYENADPRHPHQLAEVLESYADLMEATGRPRRARTLRRRAATLR